MRLGVIALACLLTASCLSPAYGVSRDEAMRLASLDPAVRGERVRVVQQLTTDEPPPRAPAPVVYVPGVRVVVGARVSPVGSPGLLGIHLGGGGGGGGNGGAAIAVAVVVAGAVIGVALAATEGERYDGWARVGPMHPLHVTYPNGSQQWMPLAALDPMTAQVASHLELRDDEGPFQDVGRAPLNRVGGTYGLEIGAGSQHVPGLAAGVGFVSHLSVGGFPLQWLGLLADVSFGIGDVLSTGVAGELQVIPIDAGIFHLGAYGRVGGMYADDGVGRNGWSLAFGAGLLAQLEITTRLAFVLRGGASFFDDADPTFEATAGLAIY